MSSTSSSAAGSGSLSSADGDNPRHARSWFGTAHDEDDPLVGTTLGSYRIVHVLGEGAMGRVYEAQHTRLRTKRVAIKILHPEFMRHPQALARFEREAEAAGALEHRHVVGVYDVDRAPDGRPYIVCEFLEGVELGDHLDSVGQLSIQQAVRIGQHLCDALASAHRLGVVHRDMKPENVFLVGNLPHRPVAKVLDFGLSRLDQAKGDTLTQAGTVMGTPSYMAPEQARGDRVDGRADVYGVGAILYRALTGHRPFERDDAPSTLAAVLTEDPPRPRSLMPLLPEEFEVVIQRAMAKDPEQRFQTMDDLSAALAAFSQSIDEPPPSGDARRRLDQRLASASPSIGALPFAVRHVRPRLVMTGVVAMLWSLGVLVTAAASAVALAAGRDGEGGLTTAEIALLVVAALAGLTTPLVLAVRHIKRYVWQDSTRVLRLLASMRAVLAASMVAYAATAVTIRLIDGFVSRFSDDELMVGPEGTAWPAWTLVLAAVSALAAAAEALRRALVSGGGRRGPSRIRTFFAGPALGGVTLLVAAALLYGGLSWRASMESAAAHAPPVVADDPPADSVPQPEPEPSVTASASAEPEVERATADDLAHAVARGAPALEALAQRFPADPAIMRALVDAYAGDEQSRLKALEWSGKLLEHEPDVSSWRTVRNLVLRCSQSDEPVASRAFELMTTQMGSDGLDLLYDLMIASRPESRERAQKILSLAPVRERGSAAFRIAYDLRTAESCGEQAKMLDRAAADGDERSAATLSFVIEGSKRGCGPQRKSPCRARCADKPYAEQMRVTIDKIRARAGG
jgi:serine/threonine-protein kinase